MISIHALPAEGDAGWLNPDTGVVTISIHALPAEGDINQGQHVSGGWLFQSTPSPRRATRPSPPRNVGKIYFNPRPPRGGRLLKKIIGCLLLEFQSTPSPRRATSKSSILVGEMAFQSTPSPRRATVVCIITAVCHNDFNPRPPRGGRRITLNGCSPSNVNFNPRPPRGGRPYLNFVIK